MVGSPSMDLSSFYISYLDEADPRLNRMAKVNKINRIALCNFDVNYSGMVKPNSAGIWGYRHPCPSALNFHSAKMFHLNLCTVSKLPGPESACFSVYITTLVQPNMDQKDEVVVSFIPPLFMAQLGPSTEP